MTDVCTQPITVTSGHTKAETRRVNGVLHSIEYPAEVRWFDGKICYGAWYFNEKLHRDGGPAVWETKKKVRKNGTNTEIYIEQADPR